MGRSFLGYGTGEIGEPISNQAARDLEPGQLPQDLMRKVTIRYRLVIRHFLATCGLMALVASLAAQLAVAAPPPQREQRIQGVRPGQAQPAVSTSTRPGLSPALASSPAAAEVAQPSLTHPGRGGKRLPWNTSELVRFGLALVVSSVFAAVRLKDKFRHYWGLGLIHNGYCWMFIGFVASLSAFSYMGLVELEGLLKSYLNPGFLDALKIGGAGAGGQALVALGRLGPRPRPNRAAPGQGSSWQELVTANALLAFFYNGIYDHITERMHVEVRGLARRFDWKTVRGCACTLLEDEMTVGRLPGEHGRTVVERIRALPPASSPDEEFNNKYLALSWTVGKCSYSQIESRLREKAS